MNTLYGALSLRLARQLDGSEDTLFPDRCGQNAAAGTTNHEEPSQLEASKTPAGQEGIRSPRVRRRGATPVCNRRHRRLRGRIEALAQFLGNVQADSRLAFVVIQHLDPTLKGMMPELLQRTTSMKVLQVKDGLLVRPGCVYVIPPNKDMSILHGKLHLLEPVAPRGLRLPIDFFFRSLAEDQREFGVWVSFRAWAATGRSA